MSREPRVLRPDVAEEVRRHLGLLRAPITLAVDAGSGPGGREVAGLAEDLADLSVLISLDDAELDRRPGFEVRRDGAGEAVAFAGPPLGAALSALVLALLHVSGHPPRVAPDLLDEVRSLGLVGEAETFFAASCRTCPETVQAMNVISLVSPGLRHTAVNGAAFPDEVAARAITDVPRIYLDGAQIAQGRSAVADLLPVLRTVAGPGRSHT